MQEKSRKTFSSPQFLPLTHGVRHSALDVGAQQITHGRNRQPPYVGRVGDGGARVADGRVAAVELFAGGQQLHEQGEISAHEKAARKLIGQKLITKCIS